MSTRDDWRKAYARQAEADLAAWQAVRTTAGTAECHRLQLLQMACEKLCKAFLIDGGTDPAALRSSHGYVANPLPTVIRHEILGQRGSLKGMRGVLAHVRHLAREIELLSPACDDGGRRPDNCEYPWEDGSGRVRSPLDQGFHPSRLLAVPAGRTFVKLVRGAIDRLLP
jgi:hypothetical protein